MKSARIAIVALLMMLPLTAQSQLDGLPGNAYQALGSANASMQEALTTYDAHFPDRPLWQETFRHARRAISLAPGHPEPVRFLAEAYSRANWYGPAWNAWLDYLAQGHDLRAEDDRLFAEVGHQMGWSHYTAGELEEALSIYRTVIDVVPFDLEAYTWAGRILLELERPEAAISYWQTVADRNPEDARARYFVELARDQAEWGVQAATAFREGVAFYEEGDMTRARERFARATSLNQRYPEAWAWLGRVAFETSNYADARTYYTRASDLEPGNQTYRYFREEAGRRLEGATGE